MTRVLPTFKPKIAEVPCPYCGAKPGDPCRVRTRPGKRLGRPRYPHEARWAAQWR